MTTIVFGISLAGIILAMIVYRKSFGRSIFHLAPVLLSLWSALIFSTIYMVKDNHYPNILSRYFLLPRRVINWIAFIPISSENLIRCLTISCMLFILACVVFSTYMSFAQKPKVRVLLSCVTAFILLLETAFYDPAFYRFLYLNAYPSHISCTDWIALMNVIHKSTTMLNLGFLGVSLLCFGRYVSQIPKYKDLRFAGFLFFFCFVVLIFSYIFMFYWMPTHLISISKIAGGYTWVLSMPLVGDYGLYRVVSTMQVVSSIVIAVACYRNAVLYWDNNNVQIRISKDIDTVSLTVRVFCHYLKNELLAIRSQMELARMEPNQALVYRYMDDVEGRVSDIFERLNTIHHDSTKHSMRLKRVLLNEFILYLARDLQPLGDDVPLEVKLPEVPVYCLLDTYLFSQALQNIIKNAEDAVRLVEPERRRIAVTLTAQSLWTTVTVRDSGIGIAYENQKKIFEPFFTTKGSDVNWGVGLSFTQKIILAHSGRISVHSQPGCFTEISVLLPRVR